ncbi:unnamed protein product [Boreogadus saida]
MLRLWRGPAGDSDGRPPSAAVQEAHGRLTSPNSSICNAPRNMLMPVPCQLRTTGNGPVSGGQGPTLWSRQIARTGPVPCQAPGLALCWLHSCHG